MAIDDYAGVFCAGVEPTSKIISSPTAAALATDSQRASIWEHSVMVLSCSGCATVVTIQIATFIERLKHAQRLSSDTNALEGIMDDFEESLKPETYFRMMLQENRDKKRP